VADDSVRQPTYQREKSKEFDRHTAEDDIDPSACGGVQTGSRGGDSLFASGADFVPGARTRSSLAAPGRESASEMLCQPFWMTTMRSMTLPTTFGTAILAGGPLAASSALAQGGYGMGTGMMGGYGAGWMGGGYGGIWLLVLLVAVIVGLVAWIIAKKSK
jgi:hypothetical protein